MLSTTLLKWAVPSAAAVMLATVPAIAAHVSHKPLAATHKTAHSLVTTTPAGAAKAHTLHTTPAKARTLHTLKSTKAKTLAAHKPAARHTLAAKSHKPTTLAQKKTSSLDKPASVVSNM